MCEEFNHATKMQCEATDDLMKESKARYGLNTAKLTNMGLVSVVETWVASHVSPLDSLAHNRSV